MSMSWSIPTRIMSRKCASVTMLLAGLPSATSLSIGNGKGGIFSRLFCIRYIDRSRSSGSIPTAVPKCALGIRIDRCISHHLRSDGIERAARSLPIVALRAAGEGVDHLPIFAFTAADAGDRLAGKIMADLPNNAVSGSADGSASGNAHGGVSANLVGTTRDAARRARSTANGIVSKTENSANPGFGK